MNEDRRLPGGLRNELARALQLAEELRGSQDVDEEVQSQLLDDLKSCVADVLVDLRSSNLPLKKEIARPLKIADGILTYLADPGQRDARGRLRDVAAYLREAMDPQAGDGSL